MSIVVRVLLGLGIMAVGFAIVLKTDMVRSWFGEIPWAERTLGPGGTRMFLKLIGAGVAGLGILIATNIISDILNSFASIFIRT